MCSLFFVVTKLGCAIWPIAINTNDFVDPILMDHKLNWLR